MLEGIVLGTIQGVAEWLPVSSEGMITLAKIHLFQNTGLEGIIKLALFLHLGTFLSALIYFRRDVGVVLQGQDKGVLKFLTISTVISGALGFLLLEGLLSFENQIELSGRILTGIIGLLLLVTAWLQLKRPRENQRPASEVGVRDSVILGLAQGLAVLPGLSRSGLTVSTLLLLKVREDEALRLSFLMSLPIVLAGNILLNFHSITHLTPTAMWGLLFSFIFGLATIHILMRVACRVNFGKFVGLFGILMILASLV